MTDQEYKEHVEIIFNLFIMEFFDMSMHKKINCLAEIECEIIYFSTIKYPWFKKIQDCFPEGERSTDTLKIEGYINKNVDIKFKKNELLKLPKFLNYIEYAE